MITNSYLLILILFPIKKIIKDILIYKALFTIELSI
jgi:hypothetical protein